MPVPPLNKILLVEDDSDIQLVEALALPDIGGFELKICGSGAEALSSIDDFQPDLVMLDVVMPGMDGVATCQALRALPHHAKTPVVFMTARVQDAEVEGYRKLGAMGVVKKPSDAMLLADEVRGIWAS